jgi:hypothetical protein
MANTHLIRRWLRAGALLAALYAPAGLAQAAPRVTRAPWGATPGGDTVWQYTLVNRRGMTVRAITLGAIITNIVVPDRDKKLDDVVLGMTDVEGSAPEMRDFSFWPRASAAPRRLVQVRRRARPLAPGSHPRPATPSNRTPNVYVAFCPNGPDDQ